MNKKSFTIFLIKRIFIFVSIVSFSTLSFNNLIVAIAETEKEEKNTIYVIHQFRKINFQMIGSHHLEMVSQNMILDISIEKFKII